MLRQPPLPDVSFALRVSPPNTKQLRRGLFVSNDNRLQELASSVVDNAADNAAVTACDAPPNGGLRAWLQVAGSFFLFFNSWGVVNTFGVFQSYYEVFFAGKATPSDISWIGSIQSFLLMFLGVAAGPLYDSGYFYVLIGIGTCLVVFGLVMTSLCVEYWQVILAQGLCTGIGTGCFYVPAIAILPQYFSTRKALATGLAASGSSLGGIIFPIVFRQLEPAIGFGWTTRLLALISLVTCLLSISVMRTRLIPQQKRSFLELSAFRETPYMFFCAAMFFGNIGFFGPLFYVQTYVIQTRIASRNLSFYLLPMLNAASIPGRIVPGFFAGKIGPLNVLLPAATITGILTLCWIGIHNTPGIVLFSVLYGFFSGGFVSLPGTALASLTPDLARLGTRIGMYSMICSIGSLVGAPISGAILGDTGSFLGLQLFSGTTMFLTGVLLLVTRISREGPKIRVNI
ncbi:Aspyridones efflux apdF [Hyphodiscus hymeniophilus]|uniref:Aspyridones efflux apdF n=1 Tax=Hyphodiscus hymeniophilus TaxID=353542 RepID=A0A9P7AZN9_9HELO|nr:Aspyridones efflux apdF [Hyphodiscus hymeniophilus]